MASTVVQAIPANQLVNVPGGVLPAGGSPLQFWGLIVDANLDGDGYPVMPSGEVLLFADATDVDNYFGATSQEAGLSSVYFTGPVNATVTPSGLLMVQYALYNTPGFLRGGSLAATTLSQLRTLDASLTVVIDGADPITATVNLAAATSFSNAAEIIGTALGTAASAQLNGIAKGTFTASLTNSTSTMTVTELGHGPVRAVFTASLVALSSEMVVESVTAGYVGIGDVVVGTGIPDGTTVASYSGDGVPGGVGVYVLSQAPSDESAETVTAYAGAPQIGLGDYVTGTGIPANTYVEAFGTGTGGLGTYILSAAPTTESAEAILLFAAPVVYNPLHHAFQVQSGSLGADSTVEYATGAAATTLGLTRAAGAISSPGRAADNPTAFMDGVTAVTKNWVSFMTTWEPTDADKSLDESSSFAWWNNAQGNGYRYCMWETDVLDTEQNPGSASSAEINAANLSGTVMIWTNPNVTTLPGEKAAFAMSWAASLDFAAKNGRATLAFKSYVGGLPDVVDGTVSVVLAGSPQSGTFGNGINFYGSYTTRSQGFVEYQRGLVSGPFVWDDTYTDQIWLNNALQNAVMIGLANVNSVPYAQPGYALIESWILDPVKAAVNFGAIVAGVPLSDAQTQAVNQATGVDAASVLFERGWYLQVQPATAATRAVRSSPPIKFWWCDGGSVQAIDLPSIAVQ